MHEFIIIDTIFKNDNRSAEYEHRFRKKWNAITPMCWCVFFKLDFGREVTEWTETHVT